MLDTMKNKRIGRDEVIEKFGVPPDKVVDVQSLAGDSIDNVPGVPGIGIKTAAELIKEYGDLDTLLARAGEIKQPKRREKLIEFADQARISPRARAPEGRRAGRACRSTRSACTSPIRRALLGFLRDDGVQHADASASPKRSASTPPPPLATSVGVERRQARRSRQRRRAGSGEAPRRRRGTPAAAVAAALAAARDGAVRSRAATRP